MALKANFISYGKNVYGKEEINAVLDTLKKTTQMSKNVNIFEKKISLFFSKRYSLMVNSGTSALILALKVLRLPKNSEVITPALNFGTAVSAIILNDLKPIFIDVEIETLQIDIKLLEKKITNNTKALLIPNLIGNIPNWIEIKKIAKKYKLKIIEDSADTLGARIGSKTTGSYSDISITSFYGSHVISCAGNGGIFLTNDKKMYLNAKSVRSWGRASTLMKDSENIRKRLNIKLKGFDYDKKFVFQDIGYNFEPSEIGAAFGLQQLSKFKKFSELRNKYFKMHSNFFKTLDSFFIIPKILKNIKTNFLAYPVIIRENKSFNKRDLQIFLEDNNVQTRPIFSGNILRHPAFSNLISKKNRLNDFKKADYIMKNGILIGCHQGLTEKNIKTIHNLILKFISKK
ncbi:aminotransferase class I/II-fold pyridoxal phosphate-dependent enzyme [Candidatus Pelagibacter sp.]|nr:aminotransferase class I/II-fold pyridoxal phosphate-dependent enzyme [Candidatus Pelagibacter sp.]